MSPTISSAAPSGTAFSSACISMTSTIEVSSMTSRSQSSGLSPSALEAAALGVDLEQPVDGLGLEPGGSRSYRLAARPVGAQSRSLTPLAARMRRIELTMVVLPTPGPPVMTSTFDSRASRIALILAFRQRQAGLSARSTAAPCWHRCRPRAACRWPARCSRSAMTCSAR